MSVTKRPITELRPAAPPPRVRRYRQMPQVEEPRGRISTALIYIVVAILIAAVGLLYLFQTNHVAGLGYEMSQLQNERASLSIRNEQLNYSVARYESLNQVESVAIGQLGMRQSDNYIFIDVPRPIHDELPPPDAEILGSPSLLERVWNGITGSASAVSGNAEAGP